MEREHRFEAQTIWTGAAHGPTRDLATFSREFRVDITGKAPLTGSSAPAFAGDAKLHNPEDLMLASLSACHMLSYLALCARAGIAVLTYEDHATGTLGQVDRTFRFTEVVLRPRVRLAAGADVAKATALHERAHALCFMAASVNFPVRNEPSVEVAE